MVWSSLACSLFRARSRSLFRHSGWNPYNHYGCGSTEVEIRKQTTALLALGLDKAGFTYINLDCGWASGTRDADGKIAANPKRFPSGIKELSDWVHSKGLRFGIYTDIGNVTCGGGAGILGHEASDAETYAEWGVDLVKNGASHDQPKHTAKHTAKHTTSPVQFFSFSL